MEVIMSPAVSQHLGKTVTKKDPRMGFSRILCFISSWSTWITVSDAHFQSCLFFPEPGGLPFMGSHRVRHNWSDLAAAAVVTKLQCISVSKQYLYLKLTVLHVNYMSVNLEGKSLWAVFRPVYSELYLSIEGFPQFYLFVYIFCWIFNLW